VILATEGCENILWDLGRGTAHPEGRAPHLYSVGDEALIRNQVEEAM